MSKVSIRNLVRGAMGLALLHAGSATAQQFCFAVADNGDQLVSILGDGTGFTDIGDLGDADTVEALTIQPGSGTIFTTVDDGDLDPALGFTTGVLGTIDAASAAFTPLGEHGSCSTDGIDTVDVDDVDGISFQPFSGALWAVNRINEAGPANSPDLLLQIDPATGAVVPDVFGPGISCLPVTGSAADIDDISFNPADGLLYGIASTAGDDTLVSIDLTTAAATEIGVTGSSGVDDIEGLSFTPDGTLFGVTGNTNTGDPDSDSLWTIDVITGAATLVVQFPSLGDYESVACMLDEDGSPLVSAIGDRVWLDANQNGILDVGEAGLAGVTVELFLDGGTTPVATTTTDATGNYSFTGLPPGDYQVGFVAPPEFMVTSQDQGIDDTTDSDADPSTGLTATITLLSDETNNTIDAGLVEVADVAITKTLTTTDRPLAVGQTVTYEIVVTNSGPAIATDVEVTDTPTNLTIDTVSSTKMPPIINKTNS